MVLEIISPQKVVFTGQADSVTLPGVQGSFTVLKNHAPIISVLAGGKIIYKTDGKESEIDIKGGLADVENNHIAVCIY